MLMPSGKQILLSLLQRFSQQPQETADLDLVSDQVRAGLLLHGSTSEETWLRIERMAWLSEEDSAGRIRQGLGIGGQQGVFLADLLEAIAEDDSLLVNLRDSYPDLGRADLRAALQVTWLLLSSLEFRENLAPVEGADDPDEEQMSRMLSSYLAKLRLSRDDPDAYFGRGEAEIAGEPIVVEQDLLVPRHLVWEAISEQDQMRRWFFEQIDTFEAKIGFQAGFDVACEGEVYPHRWEVTQVIPEERLAYTWEYGGHPGSSFVLWELSDAPGGGTRLRLSHVGHETFPQDNPAFRREACEAGWRYFIHDRLSEYLRAESGERS